MFTGFSRVLPDPYNPITTAGQRSGSIVGPGFASVSFGYEDGGQVSRTNSGRVVSRESGGSYITASITYNELTRAQFDPVSSFLLSRNCKVVPFFVEMPQYTNPQDSTFATFCSTNSLYTSSAVSSGKTYFTTTSAGTIAGLPKPNSLINIVDSTNTNHTKSYLITRVETPTDYESTLGAVPSNSLRLHVHAPISKNVASGAQINFLSPKFKCLLVSKWEYSIDNDGLYNFGLQVEEAEY